MKKRGFTLMELITVMAIMFILMGLATMSLRGLVRGAGIRGALRVTRAALSQARQYAIVNRQYTAVIFTASNAVTVAQYGTALDDNARLLRVDGSLPWKESQLEGALVFNITEMAKGYIRDSDGNDSADSFDIGGAGMYDVAGEPDDQIPWRKDDRVGFPVGAAQVMPDGLLYASFRNQPGVVLFSPTGASIDVDSSSGSTRSVTIEIEEEFGSGSALVTVSGSTGWIDIE